MSLKEYIKRFFTFIILGIGFISAYTLIARILNKVLSPNERYFIWNDFYIVLIPIVIYFGLYGLFKADINLKKSEKFLSKFRGHKIFPILFFTLSIASIISQFFLMFISLFFLHYITSPWEARGFGVFHGFILLLLFLQTIIGALLLIYFFIIKNRIKDKSSYYLVGILINITAILYYIFIYYPSFVKNFSM